jgi:hypothetical protein
MLLPTTLDVIRAALKADPNPTPADRARLLALLRAGAVPTNSPAPPGESGPRVLRRAEAARRAACCVRVIDRLAQEGKLKRVRLPGRKRGCGFLESDINALLAGKE